MKIITKQSLINSVATNWRKQYKKRDDVWRWGKDKEQIYKKLLEKRPKTEEEIAEIIGNRSWTGNICDECGKDSKITVQLGEPPDYESRTANVCENCLKKALRKSFDG